MSQTIKIDKNIPKNDEIPDVTMKPEEAKKDKIDNNIDKPKTISRLMIYKIELNNFKSYAGKKLVLYIIDFQLLYGQMDLKNQTLLKVYSLFLGIG